MTFFHFCNCAILAYVPYILAYKYSSLNEYSSYWKAAQAALIYIGAQFLKMMTLATFFPAPNSEEEFNIFIELLKDSVEIIDLLGIHLALSYFISGRGEIKFLTTGIGWAAAHSLVNYFVTLFIGSRAAGFSWHYVQTAINTNIDLFFYITMAALVWLFNRSDLSLLQKSAVKLSLVYCVFRSIIYQAFRHYLNLDSWMLVAVKLISTIIISFSTFVVYCRVKNPHHKAY